MRHRAARSAWLPGRQAYVGNNQLAFLPFLRKWTQVPDDYDALYQQALQEMQQPDFVATLNLRTAWVIYRS